MNDKRIISVHVWDLPARLFHWLLAILVCIMFFSGNYERFDIHFIAGQAIVALLIARIVWGIWGSSNLRFSALVFKPREYVQYVKSLPKRTPSFSVAHSPIGSLAVIAILIALVTQVATGLVASDVDGLVEGPFAYYVSYDLTRFASEIHVDHERWLLFLIILHVCANAFYFVYKKDNLILPMIKGAREIPEDRLERAPEFVPAWKSFAILLVAAVATATTFYIYG